MVVAAVVALHGALMAPTLSGMREEARRIQCANNLLAIGNALVQYEDAAGAMPNADASSGSFQLLREGGYLPEKQILSCPSNSLDVDLTDWEGGMSYYIDPRTPHRRHPMRAVAADRNLDGGSGGAGIVIVIPK